MFTLEMASRLVLPPESRQVPANNQALWQFATPFDIPTTLVVSRLLLLFSKLKLLNVS